MRKIPFRRGNLERKTDHAIANRALCGRVYETHAGNRKLWMLKPKVKFLMKGQRERTPPCNSVYSLPTCPPRGTRKQSQLVQVIQKRTLCLVSSKSIFSETPAEKKSKCLAFSTYRRGWVKSWKELNRPTQVETKRRKEKHILREQKRFNVWACIPKITLQTLGGVLRRISGVGWERYHRLVDVWGRGR